MTRRGGRGKGHGSEKEEDAAAAGSTVSQPRLKVVVRRLPPNLPEHVFWETVSPWVSRDGPEAVTWSYYRPGKLRQA